jgi:hypothetical protein
MEFEKKHSIFANFDEAAKLCKASDDAYNRGGRLRHGFCKKVLLTKSIF